MLAVPSAKGKLKYLVGTSILTTYPDDDIKALFDYCQGKPVSTRTHTAHTTILYLVLELCCHPCATDIV